MERVTVYTLTRHPVLVDVDNPTKVPPTRWLGPDHYFVLQSMKLPPGMTREFMEKNGRIYGTEAVKEPFNFSKIGDKLVIDRGAVELPWLFRVLF